MPRAFTPRAQPATASLEGDAQFVKINCKAPREKLSRGEIPLGINTRLRTTDAVPRAGTVTPGFANAIAFEGMLGAGFYSNPNGLEAILIATPNVVYAIADGTYPMPIPLEAGTTLDTPCEFVQAFDKILLMRGTERSPLAWDGVSAGGFQQIAMTTPDDPTKHLIPNAEYAEVFKFRLMVPVNRDDVDISDIGNYTQFDPIFENWRINMGSADKLVRIFPFSQNGAFMFKERSVLLMANFEDPQHPELAQLQPLNDAIGLAGRWAVIRAGGDVHFISRTGPGIYRLQQVLQDTTTTAPVPISDEIEPVIRRINWAAADTIHAVALGELIFWFVPLDGATAPNAALVWNNATQGWESTPDVWTPAGGLTLENGTWRIGQTSAQIDRAFVMNYQGAPAIYAIDRRATQIYVLYAPGALTDEIGYLGEQEIEMVFEDRAYARVGSLGYLFDYRGFAELGQGETAESAKDVKRSEILVETSRPSIEVTLITDQMNDERILTPAPITYSRTRNKRFGKAKYDPSNVNDDFHDPGREDYSAQPGDGIYPGSKGITPGLKQRQIIPFSIKTQAEWISYRVRNRQGYCAVKGLVSEVTPVGRRHVRRAA